MEETLRSPENAAKPDTAHKALLCKSKKRRKTYYEGK
jgi:hypothetical protein